MLAVIHETIGFQREKAKIPMSKFLWHTELPRSAIRRGLREAEARNIIIKERDSTRPSIYALNDYRKWQTRVQNEPSELGSEMNPNWGQKQTQTRSTATKKKSDTKETYKETFKEKETHHRMNSLLKRVHLSTPPRNITPPQQALVKACNPTLSRKMILTLKTYRLWIGSQATMKRCRLSTMAPSSRRRRGRLPLNSRSGSYGNSSISA